MGVARWTVARALLSSSKSEYGVRLPLPGVPEAELRPGQRLTVRSFLEPVGDSRFKSENVRFGSQADI
jgi:hypothetical protein